MCHSCSVYTCWRGRKTLHNPPHSNGIQCIPFVSYILLCMNDDGVTLLLLYDQIVDCWLICQSWTTTCRLFLVKHREICPGSSQTSVSSPGPHQPLVSLLLTNTLLLLLLPLAGLEGRRAASPFPLLGNRPTLSLLIVTKVMYCGDVIASYKQVTYSDSSIIISLSLSLSLQRRYEVIRLKCLHILHFCLSPCRQTDQHQSNEMQTSHHVVICTFGHVR